MPADTPPPTVGPYSPIVRAGDWLVCSGQLGLRDGAIVSGGVGAQLTEAIANLEVVLATAGASLAHVKKTTVFLTDIADFDEMNNAYSAAFTTNRPARSAVAVVALPRGGRVEIEAWAFLPATPP